LVLHCLKTQLDSETRWLVILAGLWVSNAGHACCAPGMRWPTAWLTHNLKCADGKAFAQR